MGTLLVLLTIDESDLPADDEDDDSEEDDDGASSKKSPARSQTNRGKNQWAFASAMTVFAS